MTRLATITLLLAALLLGCGSNGETPSTTAGGPDPAAEDTVRPPADPPEIADYETRPEAEDGAWQDRTTLGKVAIRTVDIGSGDPITDQNYHSVQFALTKDHARRRMPAMVDGPQPPAVPDGTREYELSAGFYRLRLDADGYRNTWTHEFEVKKGETTRFTQAMRRANRIRVTVLEEDGTPCEEGTLLFLAPRLRMTAHFTDGVTERLVDVDALDVVIDPRFMAGYRPSRTSVKLVADEVNEVTITLRR